MSINFNNDIIILLRDIALSSYTNWPLSFCRKKPFRNKTLDHSLINTQFAKSLLGISYQLSSDNKLNRWKWNKDLKRNAMMTPYNLRFKMHSKKKSENRTSINSPRSKRFFHNSILKYTASSRYSNEISKEKNPKFTKAYIASKLFKTNNHLESMSNNKGKSMSEDKINFYHTNNKVSMVIL